MINFLVQMQKIVRSLEGHSERIGVISWVNNTISTGIIILSL